MGLLAALFLAVTPLHVRYSHVAVTDVPAVTLGLLALLFFVRATQRRSGRALVAGALAAGLATSTKYNLGMLVVPAAVAAWYSCGDPASRAGRPFLLSPPGRVEWRYPWRLAFVAGSPFAVLDLPRFVSDFSAQNRIVANGWLGFEQRRQRLLVQPGGQPARARWDSCWSCSAWPASGWLLATRRRVDFVLVPYVVVYYLYVSSWAELMDRYLLPIVPLLIVLAVRACVAVPRTASRVRRVAAFATAFTIVAVLAVAFVLPLQASIRYADALQGVDVRTVAKSWVERHVPAGSGDRRRTVRPAAGDPSRSAPAIARPDTGPRPIGSCISSSRCPGTPDRRRTFAYLERRNVRYVIVSSQVYDRVLAAADYYPVEARFYRAPRHSRHSAQDVQPGPGRVGPGHQDLRAPA